MNNTNTGKHAINIPIRMLSIVSLIAGLAAPAHAANLLTNGDFESGTAVATLDNDNFFRVADQDKGWVQRSSIPPLSILDDGTGANNVGQMNTAAYVMQGVTLGESARGSKLKLTFDFHQTPNSKASMEFFLVGQLSGNSAFQLTWKTKKNSSGRTTSGEAIFDFVAGATLARGGEFSTSATVNTAGSYVCEFDISALSGGMYKDLSDFKSLTVGFKTMNSTKDGTLDNISLVAISESSTVVDIPEPSMLGLVVLSGMVALLRRPRANVA